MEKSSIKGGYIWHLMPIFGLGWAIPVKSHVWKFGLDWLKLELCKISGGQKPPVRGGHMWAAMPIFVHGRAISVKSLVWKFGSDWLSLSRVIVYTDKKKKKITDETENNTFGKILFRVIKNKKITDATENNIRPFRPYNNPRLRGVTCDVWCPFSNSADLFQSKVMCENLEWIGWNRRYVNFQGGGRSPLLWVVTCDLQCPFSYTAELFQSEVMCENLVRIGWAFQELSW